MGTTSALQAGNQGADAGGIAKAAFTSAAMAYAGASIGGVDGSGFGWNIETLSFSAMGGITSMIQGGNFGHGFISAGIGSVVGGSISGIGYTNTIDAIGRTLLSAALGGTISELTGGKFANGAGYAAFSALMSESIRWRMKQAYADRVRRLNSPTSQDIETPRSVNFVSDEGKWGKVHWTGEASGVEQLRKDLNVLADIDAMQKIVKEKQNSGEILHIRASMQRLNNGENYSIMVGVSTSTPLLTVEGWQLAPSIIKLAHELPHAVMGVGGTNMDEMKVINEYENPVRRYFGLPDRVAH